MLQLPLWPQHNTTASPAPPPCPVPRLLASLETVLRCPEAVYEEFERLQEFCRDHVTGDTHTATQPANRGKNRSTTDKSIYF